MGSKFLWSGKTTLGREALEEVYAETPDEARKILEARGWTELRQLSTEIDDDSPGSPAERQQFQQGAVPGFWRGWFAQFRKSPGFYILLLIFLILGIRGERKQLERDPGIEVWIGWVALLLGVGVFWYPASYWFRRWKRKMKR